MEYYLFEKSDGSYLVQGYSGEKPKIEFVSKVPKEIDPLDFEFTEAQKTGDTISVFVNTERKATVLAERAALEKELKDKEKAKDDKKIKLLEDLAKTKESGSIGLLIELILLNEGIETT